MPTQANPFDLFNTSGSIISTTGSPGTPGLAGNTASTAALSNLVNSLNQASQQTALAGRIPQNPALEAKSSANISSALAGQLPSDVINLMGQQSAERGVMTGMPSAPANNAAYLKALGLTSLGQMNTGQQWLSAADARNPIAPVTDAMDAYRTLSGEQLAYQKLAQDRELAYQQDATNRLLGQQRLAGMGTSTGKAPATYTPPPQFPTGTPTRGGGATQTGTTTSNDIWDPLMWDYFPELMYQGDLSSSATAPIGDMLWSPSNTSFGLGLDNYMNPQGSQTGFTSDWNDFNWGNPSFNWSTPTTSDQSNLDSWDTWGDYWW